MPGSTAATTYGNQGGGWLPKTDGDRYPIRVDVPARGGPSDGLTMALWSFGAEPDLPSVLPYPGLGRYELVDGTCERDPEKLTAWTTGGHYRWKADR